MELGKCLCTTDGCQPSLAVCARLDRTRRRSARAPHLSYPVKPPPPREPSRLAPLPLLSRRPSGGGMRKSNMLLILFSLPTQQLHLSVFGLDDEKRRP